MAREIEHGTRAAFYSVDDSNGFVNRRSPVQSWAPAPSSRKKVPADRKPISHPSIPGAMLVPLTQGHFALIDECDAEAVAALTWGTHFSRGGKLYARRGSSGNALLSLHRFIWSLSGGGDTPEVDHRDGDGLNCRRENLRAATHEQNTRNARVRKDNASGLKGVRLEGSRWLARISIDGQLTQIGRFDSAAEAHAAYFARAVELRGEFARAS